MSWAASETFKEQRLCALRLEAGRRQAFAERAVAKMGLDPDKPL